MFEILLVMVALQIKHYYADFVVQTYAQTVRKGIYRDPVGISHSVDHIIGSLVALLVVGLFVNIDPVLLFGVCVVEGILHYHIDWAKVHYGSKDITKPIFWNQFGMDQLAHQLTYIGMIIVLLS